MKADLLREKFLSFFKSRKHKIVESDSLVPKDDPTVLFTPAGMNQFKKFFFSAITDFRRAATSQRCLRTDDLDKVGKTPGHHTFFEMLGNFSFGDYFKDEAITFAWEFLTEELKIKKDKFWVSVYNDDNEAYQIWKDKIRVSAEKILKLGDKENFWPSEAKKKGPNGPCGPCSEIFFDQGKNIGCGKDDCNPSCGCGRFVEVWNLVFTQFNRKDGGRLEPLPQKNIDTGMGLERLVALMQGVANNFETDLFKPLTKEIILAAKNNDTKNMPLIYAVADHIRAIVFAIYDGVLPSNEGRGYVIRKLIRKSSLHLRTLGLTKPFLYKLVPILAEIMQSPYPELKERRENIAEIILAEEKSFASILDTSGPLLKQEEKPILESAQNDKLTQSRNANGFIIASQRTANAIAISATRLHDTYGVPPEISIGYYINSLAKASVAIDVVAINPTFESERNKLKALSKSKSAMKGDVFDGKALNLKVKETKFVGYADYEIKGKILKIIKGSCEVKSITKGDEAKIILDKTCFYPESGGQVGDTGELLKGKNVFEVLDTKKLDKIIIHIGRVKEGNFKKQDMVLAKIDIERRLAIARNHTATHLLQAALRKVLGLHIKQQGSLVEAERLRFDFTHFKDLTPTELDRVEETVNHYVINNYSLTSKQMPLPEARKSGALAFFGEKYEGKVRVVSISGISQEFCGGTHLDSTGKIGLFKITQESAVASGVRRIEAITGTLAYKAVKEKEKIILNISLTLGVPADKIAQELEKRLNRIKELERKISSEKFSNMEASLETLVQNAELINGIKVITKISENLDMDILRRTVDLIKGKTDNAVIAIGTNNSGKVLLVMGVTQDLCSKGIDASRLIREVSAAFGGSGGGRNDFAQAGGNKPEKLDNAFEKLRGIISQIKL
jgi:alanyl-tRNA synthetase